MMSSAGLHRTAAGRLGGYLWLAAIRTCRAGGQAVVCITLDGLMVPAEIRAQR